MGIRSFRPASPDATSARGEHAAGPGGIQEPGTKDPDRGPDACPVESSIVTSDWLRSLAASTSAVPAGTTRVAVIDPADLRLVASSHPVEPAVLADVERVYGEAIRRANRDGRTVGWDDCETAVGLESFAHSGALVWDGRRRHAGLVVASWPAMRPPHEYFEPLDSTMSTVLPFLIDKDQRVLLADPRVVMADHRLDELIGSHSSLSTHPGDWARCEPYRRAVLEGNAEAAECVMRKIGANGAWFNELTVLRRLAGRTDAFLETLLALGAKRQRIDTSILSDDELTLLADFYEGLGIAGCSRRHQVSTKTIRNRMSKVYRRLGVGGSREMFRTYDPPDRVLTGGRGMRVVPLEPL